MEIHECPHFKLWSDNVHNAGNKVLAFNTLWRFDVGNGFPLAWAAHVEVEVASEGRVKANEFILSRPDIAHVVAIWVNAEDPLGSKVILVKEFRSPGRTLDGFIRELPGGSGFKGESPLESASNELYEETGLRFSPERFSLLGSKQVAGTFSTHKAHTYIVQLDASEIGKAINQFVDADVCGNEHETERTYPYVTTVSEILRNNVDWSNTGMVLQALAVST